jgi:ribosomal protein S18 acetylase RimI-like enzyme
MDPNNPEVEIRELEVEDIPVVYHLGNRLFHGPQYATLYRTWDPYEVTTGFNLDPELCLVAAAGNGEVVGFALGTTYEKEKGAWKYGYVVWLGVDPDHQRLRLGSRLYQEMEHRMRAQGVRMVLMDTAASNRGAIDFFKKMGFGKPTNQVWMSKVLRDRGPKKGERTSPLRRKHSSLELRPPSGN